MSFRGQAHSSIQGVGAERVKNAVENGIRDLGENRVQEAQEKIAIIKASLPEARVNGI